MKNKWLIICLLLCGTICAFAQSTDVDKMFPNAVMTRAHYDKLVVDIKNGGSGFPNNWYMKKIAEPARSIVSSDRKTTPVVSRDDNPNKIDIGYEMKAIHQLCLAYAITQEQSFLNKAVEYLKAWSEVNVANSKKNIHEEVYNSAIAGYSMIRKVINDDDRNTIDAWIRKRANLFVQENDLRDNNWGTCLLYQYYLLGMVLEDQAVVNKYLNQYDTWVKKNLLPNGTTTDLLGRDAFAYHAYDLLFFARIFHLKAMYEGYEKADEFYARDINWGASVKNCVNFWKPFLTDPEKFTHLEFVETEYAPDKTRSDYNKPYAPSGTMYVVYELYEADQSLKEVLSQYKINPESSIELGLSFLRWHYSIN